MAWRRPGDKPLSEPMMIILLTHICVTRPQWVNLKLHGISFVHDIFICCLTLKNWHRARQWYYRSRCKISKPFNCWAIDYGWRKFREICVYPLRTVILTTWFISIYWNHFPNKSVIYTNNKLISLLTRYLGWLCFLLISTTPRVCIFKLEHDDVIKRNHFPRYWHKSQWRGALMFSLIYAWINDWVNNRKAGDLRRHRGHYGVIVMESYVQVYIGNGSPKLCLCVISIYIKHS